MTIDVRGELGRNRDVDIGIVADASAFGWTGFDYDTLIRFELPVVGIISNNAAWNQIRFGQIDKYGRERGDVANLLNPTRYDKIVEAMGGYGEHVTEPGDIRPALERARESGQPTLVNIMVDPDVFKRRHDAADDVPIVPHSRHVQVAIRPLCA